MVIRKQGSTWILYTKDGKKKLGTFRTYKAALKRELFSFHLLAAGRTFFHSLTPV
ncbi:hypothetical protein HYU22_02250 [Candidatus Woesearchaeota archaeon]|nr:hypothetical protein [Candidatus Woesearchaeota archaeon]